MICNSKGPFPVVYERDGHLLVRCHCGLAFQDPQPGEDVLDDSYYHDADFSAALFEELREITSERAHQNLAHLRDAGPLNPGMRALDVGASSGAWLEVAAENGILATGVEIGATTAAAARSRGLDVRTGTLEQSFPGLGEQRYDLITFWDVLEHLRDPRIELDLARRLLAPGGRIAATFPNIEGAYPRLTYRLLARRTGTWQHPELPLHLYEFSPRTTRGLFSRAGFEVDHLATYAIPYRHLASTALSPTHIGRGPRAAALRAVPGPAGCRLTDRSVGRAR